MPFRVLSIDGGGIRGIIPALILAELEQRAERPIAKMFDLVAGTSTGGILAVGLTMAGARRKPKYSRVISWRSTRRKATTSFTARSIRATASSGVLAERFKVLKLLAKDLIATHSDAIDEVERLTG